MNENLRLKSIGDILKSDTSEYNFFIPSYQRGYRWGEKQVNELLDDISSFSKNKKEEDFYCLQPIVVNKDNDKYRVIDGQQRLTTIYIILKYFNEVEFKRPKPLFNIFLIQDHQMKNSLSCWIIILLKKMKFLKLILINFI